MGDSSNGKENTPSRDEQEMKKYDNRSNLCVAGALLCFAASAALFFFVSPIAGIALVGGGIVVAGIGVHQACQFREYRKKVENAKKDNGGGKSNVVSTEQDITKGQQQDIEQKQNIVNLGFPDQQFNNRQNNDVNNCGLNGLTNVGGTNINNINSGVQKDFQKDNIQDKTNTLNI